MSDVHEDVGHTFVHFLYSGDYETLNWPLDESTSDIAREYKRSILVYQASRIYYLPDLEALAKQKIEQLGEEVSVLYIHLIAKIAPGSCTLKLLSVYKTSYIG